MPAVLSYQFWQSQFGGDRAILGRTLLLARSSERRKEISIRLAFAA